MSSDENKPVGKPVSGGADHNWEGAKVSGEWQPGDTHPGQAEWERAQAAAGDAQDANLRAGAGPAPQQAETEPAPVSINPADPNDPTAADRSFQARMQALPCAVALEIAEAELMPKTGDLGSWVPDATAVEGKADKMAAWILGQQGPGPEYPQDREPVAPREVEPLSDAEAGAVIREERPAPAETTPDLPLSEEIEDVARHWNIPSGRRDDLRLDQLVCLLSGEPQTPETEAIWRRKIGHLRRDINSDLRELKRLRALPLVVKNPTAALAKEISEEAAQPWPTEGGLPTPDALSESLSGMVGPGATDPREGQHKVTVHSDGLVDIEPPLPETETPLNVRVLADDQEPGRDAAVAEIEGLANRLKMMVHDAYGTRAAEIGASNEAMAGILSRLGMLHALPTVQELKRHSSSNIAELRQRIELVIGAPSNTHHMPTLKEFKQHDRGFWGQFRDRIDSYTGGNYPPNLEGTVERLVIAASMYGWHKVAEWVVLEHGADEAQAMKAALTTIFPDPVEFAEEDKPEQVTPTERAGPPTPRQVPEVWPGPTPKEFSAALRRWVPTPASSADSLSDVYDEKSIMRGEAPRVQVLAFEIDSMLEIRHQRRIGSDAMRAGIRSRVREMTLLAKSTPEIAIDNFIGVVSDDSWGSALALIQDRHGVERLNAMQSALRGYLNQSADPLQSPGLDIDRFVKLGTEMGWRGVLSMMHKRAGNTVVLNLAEETRQYLAS